MKSTSNTRPTQKFVRNPRDIEEALDSRDYTLDRYEVTDDIHLTEEEFRELASDFILPQSYLRGKGGGASDFPVPRIFFEMSMTERLFNLRRQVVRVTGDGDFPYALLIDPQGYGYARYVAVEFLK